MGKTRRKSKTRKNIPSQPNIPPVQKHVKPGDDFYKHINGNWIHHSSIPAFMSSYGVSEEIEEQINNELLAILEESQIKVRNTADKHIPHTIYLLGTLTESTLNTKTQDLNVKFVKALVGRMRCIRNIEDLGSVFGEFLKYRIKSVLGSVVVPPEKDAKILRVAITPGELGLPDPTYYSNINSRIIKAYVKLLNRLGIAFDIEGIDRIVSIERNAALSLIESRIDNELLINGYKLREKYSAIPWLSIFESAFGWEPSKFDSMQILLFSEKWISSLNKWIRTLPLELWQLWCMSNVVLHFLPLLPPPYDDLEFELFGHRMKGQSEKLPQKMLALRLAQQWLTGSLGDIFVKRYVPYNVKENAFSIAKEIREMASERIGTVDWLEKKTREIAQRKINNIYLGIAYPNQIQKDKKTRLNPERLIENIINLSHLDFIDEAEKINKPLNSAEWEDPVFSVNAYYYNEGNRLILPSGILRWPFFHPSASDGWNFGGLGATIGHEICHAFDNDGKDFDEFGNRNIWWNKSEQARYRKKAKLIIELYNQTKYFGHNLNGALTLSENIADLGGLDIALAALKKRLKKRNVSSSEMKKQLCDFFTSYAVSWRTKEKKEKAMQSLFMDVHAPPFSRVNNIVCQFDEWYECFDVKPGDELYKSSETRIHIF